MVEVTGCICFASAALVWGRLVPLSGETAARGCFSVDSRLLEVQILFISMIKKKTPKIGVSFFMVEVIGCICFASAALVWGRLVPLSGETAARGYFSVASRLLKVQILFISMIKKENPENRSFIFYGRGDRI